MKAPHDSPVELTNIPKGLALGSGQPFGSEP